MPNNFTLLPAFANSEGSNTAVLPENNVALDTYFKASENKFRDKAFAYKQHQDEVKQKLDALDFNTAGILDKDEPVIRDQIFSAIDYVSKHPDSVDPSSPLFTEQRKNFEKINLDINQSKQDKAIVDLNTKGIAEGKISPRHMEDINSWKNGELGGRGELALSPDVEDNPFTDAKNLEGLLIADNPTVTMTPKGYGFVEQTETTPFKTDKVEEGIKALWSASPAKQDVAQQAFNQLDDATKQSEGIQSPYDLFRYSRLKTMNLAPDVKSKLMGINYAPASARDDTADKVKWIASNAHNLSDPNSDIFTENITSQEGKSIKGSKVFNGLTINTGRKDADGKPIYSSITRMVNIDGKPYAQVGALTTGAGRIAVKDLIPIVDEKNQLIVPFVNKEYGTSQNTAELVQKSFDIFDSMKGGHQSNTSSKKTYKGLDANGNPIFE